MQSHHNLRTLRLWVLAWFVMALAAAVASPLVVPRSMELVCSGTGSAKLVVKTAEGLVAADATGLDCPVCLAADTPPTTHLAAATTAAAPPFQLSDPKEENHDREKRQSPSRCWPGPTQLHQHGGPCRADCRRRRMQRK